MDAGSVALVAEPTSGGASRMRRVHLCKMLQVLGGFFACEDGHKGRNSPRHPQRPMHPSVYVYPNEERRLLSVLGTCLAVPVSHESKLRRSAFLLEHRSCGHEI